MLEVCKKVENGHVHYETYVDGEFRESCELSELHNLLQAEYSTY